MTDKGVVLNEKVAKWSDDIQKQLTFNSDSSTVTEETSTFEMFMEGENLSVDDFQKVNDYRTTYVAAATHAFGKISVDAMKKDKKLERVTGDLAMDGKDSLSMSIDRKKTYQNRLGGSNDEIIKYGVITTALESQAGKNAGQLKKARAIIGEIAKDALK